MKAFASKRIAFFLFLVLFFLALGHLRPVAYADYYCATGLCGDWTKMGCYFGSSCYNVGDACTCPIGGDICYTQTLPVAYDGAGNSCSGGEGVTESWTQYLGQCSVTAQGHSGQCHAHWALYQANCNTGDKCFSGETFTRWGQSDCTASSGRHTCCNASGQPTACLLMSPYVSVPPNTNIPGNRGQCDQSNGNYEVAYGSPCVAAQNGVCGATEGTCTAGGGPTGLSGDASHGWTWTCTGSGGGSNTSCSRACTTPVAGGWSGWTSTTSNQYPDGGGGTCSQTCGTGQQRHTCNNPAPLCGGTCPGDQSGVQNCNIQSCTYNAPVIVFVDYNDNGVQDINGQGGWTGPSEPPYNGTATITYNGGTSSGSPKSFSGGITTISNILVNQTENITLSGIPSDWKITTTNPTSVRSSGADAPVNFGIQPPPPVCTPNFITVDSPIFLGGVSSLKTGCSAGGGTGTALNYEWFISPDLALNHPAAPNNFGNLSTVTPPAVLSPNNIFNAPAIGTTYYPYVVDASVSVCNPGTTTSTGGTTLPVCTTIGGKITVQPKYSISGLIFTDTNKNGEYDPGEPNYTGSPALKVSICPGQFCPQANWLNAPGGNFTSGTTLPALPVGQSYTVTLQTMPTNPDGSTDKDWSLTTKPPTYSVTVGYPSGSPKCSPSGNKGSCDANGDIILLPFGITNMNTWIQTTGGDIYQAGNITNLEPSVTSQCSDPADGASKGHMSIGLGNSSNIQMPGVVFTDSGSSDPNFGAGDASLKKWMVKDSLDVPSATSYVAMKKTITDNHITIQPSPCPDVNNCALPTTSSTPGGVVYTIGQASDTVKITSGTTFAHDNSANDKFTFLIPGNLDIGANISALPGSVVTFIVGGDITVEPTVGTGKGNYTVSTSNIDGYYAAGGSFTVKGNSDCVSANPDQRLNISGAIVTNTNRAGGNFVVQRDMCGGDVCPTFSIQARPDFVLNTPSYLLSPNINWDEVAP